ncbi:MAG: sugar transferase [Flavobacteriaceae bacterium]|nr:sugar transferase [Flavobacteriaceae bacterium]
MLKRIFDLFFSLFGLFVCFIPMFILIFLATISTKKLGLYTQKRVGKHAILFTMFKIRTMKGEDDEVFMTLQSNNRITPFGKFLRKFKLDELPQLFNVFIGNMSLVGPRPDVVGYADELVGTDRIILTIKPGITGPATIKFKNEEAILEHQINPLKYNDEVIWKEKIRINKKYIEDWTLIGDLKFILKTIFG